jgi:streptogramin lyase
LSEFPAALRARKDFQAAAKELGANLLPRGDGEVAFSLREVTGAIEALAVNGATGELFFGDGCNRVVWQRAKDGALRRFSMPAEEMLGVMGLAWDGPRRALWAATAAVPGMRDLATIGAGRSALVELDAATGAVRRSFGLEPQGDEAHELRGVVVGPDGVVWVVDRAARYLWRWTEGAARLERVASDPEWLAPRGVAVLADGRVIVGDEQSGLHRVDPTDGSVAAVDLPPNATLTGLTGMVGRGDAVYVLQGDVRPARLVRVGLAAGPGAPARLSVLEAGHLAMSGPAAAAVSERGEVWFVGNAGWGRVQNGPSAPRPVPVFRAKGTAPGR